MERVLDVRGEVAAVGREVVRADFSAVNVRAGLVCLPVIAAWFYFGIVSGGHEGAVLAVAGAVAVAFGMFQRLGKRRGRSMVITLVGIAAATFAGAVAGHFGWGWLVGLVAVSGFLFGAMTMLGYGAWWVGLQWIIGLLVYGAHPAEVEGAAWDAAFVFLGGATQLVWLMGLHPVTDKWYLRASQAALEKDGPVLRSLWENCDVGTRAGRYALRVGAALTVGALVNHFSGMANGYWVPMTAAILIRPDLHDTAVRATLRLGGTILGAGVTTLVVAWLRPTEAWLGVGLVLAVWGCFATLRVNYGLYAMCITAYVVLLLATLGLPEVEVAGHRVAATLVGAGVAVAVHLLPLRFPAGAAAATTTS